MYPDITHIIMDILTKLIGKKVWKIEKLWQGFVVCCEVTKQYKIIKNIFLLYFFYNIII